MVKPSSARHDRQGRSTRSGRCFERVRLPAPP